MEHIHRGQICAVEKYLFRKWKGPDIEWKYVDVNAEKFHFVGTPLAAAAEQDHPVTMRPHTMSTFLYQNKKNASTYY